MVETCLTVDVCCGMGAVVIRVGPVAGNDTSTPETVTQPQLNITVYITYDRKIKIKLDHTFNTKIAIK